MQRIMNNPDNIVDEMLKGFLKAHSDIVEATDNGRVVKAKDIPEGKVGVVTGGGSGHKPAFIGYVGKNMCDAAAVGEICSSPTAAAFLDACKVADQGKGARFPARFRVYFTYILPLIVLFIFAVGYWDKFGG